MAKSSLLIEIGKRLEKCLEICREVNNGMETLRNLFSEFRLVPGNVKCYGDFLGDVLSGPVYTPYRRPYTISHYRKQMVNGIMKNKRKQCKGNPVNSVRDPRDVSVLFGFAGAVKSPVVFGFAGAGGVFPDGPVVVGCAASPCDVAPIGTTSLDGGTVITEYRSEGAFLRGVAPRDYGDLSGTMTEPCELKFLSNEGMPIEGSRSSVDFRASMPAPPGDTLNCMPGFGKAFPDEMVHENVIEISESLVDFAMISDDDVFRTGTQETKPKVSDDVELVAFYNDKTPVSGAHPFDGSAPSVGRFCCSKEPVLVEPVFADFQHKNKLLVTRVDNCMANFKSRMKHLFRKIPNLDIGISMGCHSEIGELGNVDGIKL